jgi:SAM-dependent methyltransferase
VKLRQQCHNYVASQYDTSLEFGRIHPSLCYQSQDLEKQTFADEIFDLVITQDVMEHIFDADAAFREIHRTLKPAGAHIFTTPLVNKDRPSTRRAERATSGGVLHLFAPEYHGNPMSPDGSLVTWHWGRDITEAAKKAGASECRIHSLEDPYLGIEGEYLEVVVQEK